MPVPVLTFFNNKGGVGKTSLVYHLAWMLSNQGHRVLACDLDPQANLSAAFLDEDSLEQLFENVGDLIPAATIYQCVQPLTAVGDLRPPILLPITDRLSLIPGDLLLAGFEDNLSTEWPNALGSTGLYRPFRLLTAFSTVMQDGARQMGASIIVADVGPNLGAINRSALIATDHVIVPLGADLFSLQGLRNLGPTLRAWREGWQRRKDNWQSPDFAVPEGKMNPEGYVVQQHGVRLSRPIRAYDRWINRMPKEYAETLLAIRQKTYPSSPDQDSNCLATVRHYRSLVPMAQEARKPVFALTTADGAFGGHAASVRGAYDDFSALAKVVAHKVGLATPTVRY